MKTTLNQIRKHNPCEDSWKELLKSLGKTKADYTEVSIRYILDILGVADAIWALRAVEGHDKEIRLFACECAESVLHFFEEKFPDDNRPRNAIESARRYANGEEGEDELIAARAAAAAARAAAGAATWAAGDAAGDAAGAAAGAARAAAWDAADDAAGAAAWDAARDAGAAAWAGSWVSAWAAEREKQRELLMKYI